MIALTDRLKTPSVKEMIDAYDATNSVHKAAAILGISHSRIHRALVKLNLNRRQNVFTDKENELLLNSYNQYADQGKLDELSKIMGRDKSTICGQAKKLGLTDKCRTRHYLSESISANARKRIAENGHPRGFAGHRHSDSAKETIGQKSKSMWAGMTEQERADYTMNQMKCKLEKHGTLNPVRTRGSWKAGWREIGGKRCYFRSRWEANYARYLELMKQNCVISDWQHEPKTFWFEAIKRGVRSYLPDFAVEDMDGAISYHEVKGWMDQRSRTTISRFRKYYPEETLIVIGKPEYQGIRYDVFREIPDWEE